MREIDAVLAELGLSPTEQALYLAGLACGPVGVRELVKRTSVQRTTAYHALQTLSAKGLASVAGTGARTIFTMTPPEHLEKLLILKIAELEKQARSVREIAPLLVQHVKSGFDAMQVSQFDGIAGVKAVVEKALYCKSRTWDIIAPRRNFFSDFEKAYADYFMSARKQRGITTRALWEKASPGRRLAHEEILARNPRFLPKALQGRFKAVVIIFDDKIAFIASKEQHAAVLIQSAEITATMKMLFEGLWQISEPYKNR